MNGSHASTGHGNDKNTRHIDPRMSVRPAISAVFFCVGLLVSVGSRCVFAQTLPPAQTLTDVYQQARLQDPQFRAAQKALAAGLEKLPQARAALLPSANLSASRGRQFGDSSFTQAPYIQRDLESWSWNAQITQPLFRWASWVGWRQAGAQVRQSLLQFALAEQDLLLRCAQAYTDAVLALQTQEVARNQVEAIREQLSLAERTYAVGTGTVTDVQEARAKLALAQAQKVAADNDVEVKNAELEKLLGDPVELSVTALIQPTQLIPAVSVQEVEQLRYWVGALQQNLQVQLQEAVLEVARQETAKSQAGHVPTLDLVLGRSGSYNSGSLTSPADISTLTVSNSMTVQLTVPIFSGGAIESRTREALALEEKAREELILAQRNAATQVRQAYAGVTNGQAQIAALLAAAVAGRNAVDSNKIGLKIGTRITPDVLTAEQQLFASLRDLCKARVDAAMQFLKLKAAVGQLQPEDLGLTDLALAKALNR